LSIKSKIFNYGNEHEAEWPPQFPDKNHCGHFYWDKETNTFKEGWPPNPNNKFGTAPTAIFDSMPAQYHERAGRVIESRKEWDRLDKQYGCLTFGSINEPRTHIEKGNKEKQKEIKQDRHRASEEALKMVRANPKEINQKWNKESEKQLETAKKSGLTKLLKDQGVKI